MKVSAEKIPQSQVVLEIEVEPERVEKSLDAAYRRLVRRTKVPGFRPGKAPRSMLERYLGRDVLLEEALDILIPEIYREAVEQEDIDPIELPEVEMVSTEPLVMKATVPVRPTVNLGDYQSMWIPRDPVIVPEDRIDDVLEQLRHRYATLEPVKRPLQWQDVVRADVVGAVDGRTLLDQKEIEVHLREGMTLFLPGLAEELIGLKKGAEKEIDVPIPGDFDDSRLAGKACHCRVLIHEIKEEKLPPLDDGFARQVGEGFPSLVALRERLTADLREAEEQAALDRYREQIMAVLEESGRLEYPPILVEKEIDRILREQTVPTGRQAGPASDSRNLERYLQRVGKSEEQLRQELRPVAEQRLRRSLLLSRVAEVENIDVDDVEVDQEVERMTSATGPQAGDLRRLFNSPNGREAVRRSLLTRKTWDRLISIVSADKSGLAAEGDAQSEQADADQEETV